MSSEKDADVTMAAAEAVPSNGAPGMWHDGKGHELGACLPTCYVDAHRVEGRLALDVILEGLRRASALGDVHREARFHASSLTRHLLLKYPIGDDARAELVSLLFGIATQPSLPPSLLPGFCALLSALLRRGKHLAALQLPWRPLFSLLLRLHMPKLRPCSYENRAFARSPRVELVRAAVQCRRHFGPGSASAILAAVEPLLCPHEPAEFVLGAALLALLLPTRGDEAAVWLPRVTRLWLHSGADGVVEWEALWLKLLERQAKEEFYGRAQPVDWRPILPFVHSRALLLLNLPGGHEARSELRPTVKRFPFEVISSMASFGAADALRAAARIIVLTLPPVRRALPPSLPLPAAEPLPLEPPAEELIMGGMLVEQWAELYTDAEAEAEAKMAECQAAQPEAQTANAGACAVCPPLSNGMGDAASHGAKAAGAGTGSDAVAVNGAAVSSAHGASAAATWGTLRQLLRCAEPYCHPSNTGSYCHELGALLQALCRYTYWRVFMEGRGEAASGAQPLRAADVHALVRLLRPLVVQARYSKHHMLPRLAESCYKYLGRLAPELTLPHAAERVAEGLQAVTAVHQTSVALTTLSLLIPLFLTLCPIDDLAMPLPLNGGGASATALLALAHGPAAMRSLLELALPGIDANDPSKMLMTLHAYGVLLQIVPLAGVRWAPPSTSASVSGDGCVSGKGAASLEAIGVFARSAHVKRLTEQLDAEGASPMEIDGSSGAAREASTEEALGALELQSSQAEALAEWLPELARQLLGRMLAALEHQEKMPKVHSGHSLLLAQWRMTALLFWQQLSEPLFDALLPELLRLLPRSSLLDAAKHLGAHLGAAALACPQRALDAGMPAFFAALLQPATASKSEALRALSQNELVWLIQLLAQFVRPAGKAMLPYLPKLTAIADLAAAHEELPVARAAYKLRRRMLQGLLAVYPADLRSLPPQAWADARVREQHWACWGWMPQRRRKDGVAGAMQMHWHVPSGEEVEAAAALVESVLSRGETALASIDSEGQGVAPPAASDRHISKDEQLLRRLLELRAVAKGALPFIADDMEETALGELDGKPLFNGGDSSAESAAADAVAAAESARGVYLMRCPWDGDDVELASSADGVDADCVPERVPPPPPLPRVVANCGRPTLARGTVSRVYSLLTRLGTQLEHAEATRSQLQLLRVASAALLYRSCSLLGLHRALLGFSRHSTEVRAGGVHKLMPRGLVAIKLQGRHADRLGTTLRGSTLRTPALLPLLALLGRLSLHRYALVRQAAQSAFASVLQESPWLCRALLLPAISKLSDAHAQPHECKGAAFLLSQPHVLQRVSADWVLLCALLAALCLAHEHQLPKLHQRLRTLFRDLVKSHNSPPTHVRPLAWSDEQRAQIDGLVPPDASADLPLPAAVTGAPHSAEDGEAAAALEQKRKLLREYYVALTRRHEKARSACVEAALALVHANGGGGGGGASAEGEGAEREARESREVDDGQTHCSREVSAFCTLLLLQRPLDAAAAATAAALPTSSDSSNGLPIGNRGSESGKPLELSALVEAAIGERRREVAAAAVRGLCSPTAAVRRLSRALLSAMLSKPRRGSAVLAAASAPPSLWAALPNDDAEWEAAGMQDKLGCGWGCSHYYYKGGAKQGRVNDSSGSYCHIGTSSLGADADNLLTDQKFLKRALQWLVTDHKEADDSSSSGISSLVEQMQPQDVLCIAFRGGRPWPYTDSHWISGGNFAFANAQLFKGLAANYGAAFAEAVLPATLPLCSAVGERDAQAVAAEVVAGVARGSARWPLSAQRRLWGALSPPLGAALRDVSVESVGDWQLCIRFMAFNRDPRRQQWLARVLLQQAAAAANADTSLAQANHLRFLAPLLIELGWKGAELAAELLQSPHLRDWVTHPYKQVREEVGNTLSIVLHAATPEAAAGSPGSQCETTLQEAVGAFIAHVVAEARAGVSGAGALELEPEDDAAKASVRAARETALCCLRHCLKIGRPQSCSAHLPRLLPVVLFAAASAQPPDLSNFGRSVAVLLAQSPMSQALYDALVSAVSAIASSQSWHLRGCLLPLLKLLVYRGQFIEPRGVYRSRLADLLLRLLADAQQEVREATMPLVSGFVRLHGASARRQVLAWAVQRTRKSAPLAELHAGVLGLEALVMLAPYDVPVWLPEVLERLASFANKPQPIKSSVTKTFADFRRTHQDNWAEHRQRLSVEQQELLADMVVAPSFYA